MIICSSVDSCAGSGGSLYLPNVFVCVSSFLALVALLGIAVVVFCFVVCLLVCMLFVLKELSQSSHTFFVCVSYLGHVGVTRWVYVACWSMLSYVVR